MHAAKHNEDPSTEYQMTMLDALPLLPEVAQDEVVHFEATSPHGLTRTFIDRVKLLELMFAHGVEVSGRHACLVGYRLTIDLGEGQGKLFVRTL